MTSKINWAKGLRMMRNLHQYKQKDMTDCVDGSSVSMQESGERIPSIEQLERYAEKYDITVWQLIRCIEGLGGIQEDGEHDGLRIARAYLRGLGLIQ